MTAYKCDKCKKYFDYVPNYLAIGAVYNEKTIHLCNACSDEIRKTLGLSTARERAMKAKHEST